MNVESYVVDAADIEWRHGETEGITFRGQIMLSGDDGGPEAFRFRFDPCLAVYAHMHMVSQFQMLLGGTMDLPTRTMRLRPIGVHYTDHARPYGPFSVGGDHDVLVLHPRKGGLVTMADRAARRHIHLSGRELSGVEDEIAWTEPDPAGIRMKRLTAEPRPDGPRATLIELPPGRPLRCGPSPYGRYEVVVRGSAVFGGKRVGAPGLRFVRGEHAPGDAPGDAHAGPQGAMIAVLEFDADALEGGLTGDALSMTAGEAMALAL